MRAMSLWTYGVRRLLVASEPATMARNATGTVRAAGWVSELRRPPPAGGLSMVTRNRPACPETAAAASGEPRRLPPLDSPATQVEAGSPATVARPPASGVRTLWNVVRRVRGWVREHPRLVDAALAAPLFASAIPVALTDTGGVGGPLAVLVVAFGLCFPAWFRRERPLAAFGIAASVAFLQWLLDIELMPADIVVAFAALYNVASRCGRNVSVLAAGVVELGAILAILRWEPDGLAGQQSLTATVAVIAVMVWGSSVKTRRDYLAGLEERAVRAERERDTRAQIAAAAERARIARELHDVVAHGLSVMVVQADGAAYTLDAAPERAREALGTVSSTGRNALAEMRRMLGVLREGREEEADGSYAPQPGIAQLDGLVEQVRRSGLPVEFDVEGIPQELPAGMELAAYRVVQEALTNTLKHGGPAVSGARVRLWYGDDTVEMRVSDDGRGAAAAGSDSGHERPGRLADADGGFRPDGGSGPDGGRFRRPSRTPRGESAQGHGLIGMRERVAVYGGSVDAGPKTGGGYEVVASLPLRQDSG